jgi:hypothetical protein
MNRNTHRGPRGAALVLGVAALLAAVVPVAPAARAAGAYDGAVQKAAGWVAGQQQATGAYPGFGVGSVADAVIALVAAGRSNPSSAGTKSALDYLAGQAATYAKTPGAAAKLILAFDAATGATADMHQVGGVDLEQVITGGYDAATGQYGKDVTGHALSVLALTDLGRPLGAKALDWLRQSQGSEGGWSFDGSTGPGSADTNTTGLVLQALAAAGAKSDPVVPKALAYLHAQQNSDGGFAYQKGPDAASDSNSTGMVVMGLIAVGEDPAAWQQGGAGPLDFLVRLQNPSGALRYQAAQAEDNGGATYQAIPALAGLALPLPHTLASGTAPVIAPAPGMPTTGNGPDPAFPVGLLLAGLVLVLSGRRLAARRAED